MLILTNCEFKEMGEPIKESQCYLFFEKGKIAKHTIATPRYNSAIEQFRKLLNFNKYKIVNKTLQ